MIYDKDQFVFEYIFLLVVVKCNCKLTGEVVGGGQ